MQIDQTPEWSEKLGIKPIEHKKLTRAQKAEAKKAAKATAPDNFDIGIFDSVNLKAGSVKFSGLYNKHAAWKRYLIAVLLGILMAGLIQFVLKNTGLYNSGLSAIAQGIARITNTAMLKGGVSTETAEKVFNVMFWGLYGVLNIPLYIFGYKKIGHTFCWLTVVFTATNIAVGLGIGTIHDITKVFLFCNTIPEGYVGSSETDPSLQNIFVEKGVMVLPFWYVPNGDSASIPKLDQIYNQLYDPYKALTLFIYAFVYGLGAGVAYSVLYIIGGCSGGGDFISIYRSSIKHKPLGGIMIMVNSICLVAGCVIGSYIPAGMIKPDDGYKFQFFLSANLVASFLSVVVMGFLFNKWYPMHRIVKIEISSPKIMDIRNHLFEAKFTHSMSISKTMGAYSGQEKDVLWTICMYVEMPRVIRHIKMVDPDALVIVTTVTDLEGKLKVYRQGSTE